MKLRWMAAPVLGLAMAFASQASAGPAQLGRAFSTLHSFSENGREGGARPTEALIEGKDGHLYGVSHDPGAVFRVTKRGRFEVLCTWEGDTSMEDWGLSALTQGTDGGLYGVGQACGESGSGCLYRCGLQGHLSVMHSFEDPAEGLYPGAQLTLGPDGFFYGTTLAGGENERGSLFRFGLESGFEVLDSFSSDNASLSPRSPIIVRADGTLYGTVTYGGRYQDGTLYRYSEVEGIEVVAEFPSNGGAGYPTGPMVQAEDGSFWGTGEFDHIWKVEPSGEVISVYQSDRETEGARFRGLTLGSDGIMYGAGNLGGRSTAEDTGQTTGDLPLWEGVVFTISEDGDYEPLHVFSPMPWQSGSMPESPPIMGSDGRLYGTTPEGGSAPDWVGTVYVLSLTGEGKSTDSFVLQ